MCQWKRNQYSKMLQITWYQYFRWFALDAHIHILCAKVASRLYFLKVLKHSGLLLVASMCVIRSVLECGCVVWHHNLTSAHSDRLQALQKRALYTYHPAPINITIQYCSCILSHWISETTRKFSVEILWTDLPSWELSSWPPPTWTWSFSFYQAVAFFCLSCSPRQNKMVLLVH